MKSANHTTDQIIELPVDVATYLFGCCRDFIMKVKDQKFLHLGTLS